MKIKILIVVFLLSFVGSAQQKTELFEKIKQEHSERIFYNEIFQNPALMYHFGTHQFSRVGICFQKNDDEVYRIQKPNEITNLNFFASSFLPISKTKTLWGSASYSSKNEKNIRWNETVDFDLIYPYITADEIGGDLKKEICTFLGGYNKNYKNIDIGLLLDYKANLSSRDKDPRPKNISSNLNLKLGANYKGQIFDIGFYLKGQRYSQANDIVFYNKIHQPNLYHLNGLGYFNNLFKGDKKESFYDAYGYGGGIQLGLRKQKLWLTADYSNLNIEKLNLDRNNIKIAELINKNIRVSFTKIFKGDLGVKLTYQKKSKNGIEPFFSSRNGKGLIILNQRENYIFSDEIFKLSGLFHTENIKVTPYMYYEKYRENYSLIKSFRHFDYSKIGLKLDYLYKIDSENIFSVITDFNYTKNLKNNSLLRNDDEVLLSKMLKYNTDFLSKSRANTEINIQYYYQFSQKLNLFFGLKTNIVIFENNLNTMYNFTTGIVF